MSEKELVWREKTRRWVKRGSDTYSEMVRNGEIKDESVTTKKTGGKKRVAWADREWWPRTRSISESLEEEKKMPKPRGRTFLERRGKALLKTEGKARGASTRGWGIDAPRSAGDRKMLYEECDVKRQEPCFLGEIHVNARGKLTAKFPICRRPIPGEPVNCTIDPRSLPAALVRAEQYGYTDVAQKARRLLHLQGGRTKRKPVSKR